MVCKTQRKALFPPGAKSHARKAKSELEDEKLELEIENLRKKNRWEFYLPFFQLATVIGALIGFVIGFVQFQSGQERDRATREREQTIRVETRIRTDEEETGAERPGHVPGLPAVARSPDTGVRPKGGRLLSQTNRLAVTQLVR